MHRNGLKMERWEAKFNVIVKKTAPHEGVPFYGVVLWKLKPHTKKKKKKKKNAGGFHEHCLLLYDIFFYLSVRAPTSGQNRLR